MSHLDEIKNYLDSNVQASEKHGVLEVGPVNIEADRQFVIRLGDTVDNKQKGTAWISYNPAANKWKVQIKSIAWWDGKDESAKSYFPPSSIFEFERFEEALSKLAELINQAIKEFDSSAV